MAEDSKAPEKDKTPVPDNESLKAAIREVLAEEKSPAPGGKDPEATEPAPKRGTRRDEEETVAAATRAEVARIKKEEKADAEHQALLQKVADLEKKQSEPPPIPERMDWLGKVRQWAWGSINETPGVPK